jgi:streptogramin lyase
MAADELIRDRQRRSRTAAVVLGRSLTFVLCVAVSAVAPSAAQAAPIIHEFPVKTASSQPSGVALGADGNMWFSEFSADKVGMITPSGAVTEYGGLTPNAEPAAMTPGPGGKVWFAEQGGSGAIGSVSTTGTVQELPLADGCDSVHGIAEGSDGNLWFGASCPGGPAIGRMTPTGTFTPFLVPTNNGVGDHSVESVTAGPDSNVWFTESHANRIGRITPQGKITTFGGLAANSEPTEITAANGNVWFTEANKDQIGEMTYNGTLVGEFPVAVHGRPLGIAPAADGYLWFTDANGLGKIGQMTTSGTILGEWPVPLGGNPQDIAMGNGNIWFTESSGNRIGEVLLPHVGIRYVSYNPDTFTPKVAPLTGQGQQVNWLMESPGAHGVADSSGMMLWGFTFGGFGAVYQVGTVTSYVFNSAGIYAYNDPYDPSVTGEVRVPTLVSLVPGTTNAAQVVWAATPAPGDFTYDVQVRQPGTSTWITWLGRQTIQQSTFTPSDPLYTGPGTYSFRARLRNRFSKTFSGYSEPASIPLN